MAGKLDISKEEGECDPCFLELATSDDRVDFAMGNGASFCYYANGNEMEMLVARLVCCEIQEHGFLRRGAFVWR